MVSAVVLAAASRRSPRTRATDRAIATPTTSPGAWLLIARVALLVVLAAGSAQAQAPALAPAIEHVMVYDEPGRFAAWPANGMLGIWGDELVATFEVGWFRDKPDHLDGHARDARPCEDVVARSVDGGLTWTWKLEPILSGFDEQPRLAVPMPLDHPDFAFTAHGDRFYYTVDRGRTWAGPFQLEVQGVDADMAARTDYLVRGPRQGLFFFAAQPEGATERALCAATDDGGLTFRLRSWITDADPPDHERWVFPSTVDDGEGRLLSAVRRKDERALRNWIDLYASEDDGRTWTRRSRVADTAVDGEPFNGNPPSMLRLHDGRLAVVYGVRAAPYRMALRFSADDGRTWSEEATLRDGARNWDLGYPRSVQRADGKVVTVYYFATPTNRDQFIAATIWDPATLP